MKYMKVLMLLLFAHLIVAIAVLPGCGRNISLSDGGYNPGAPVKNIKEYKDSRIYLGSFVNNAPGTKRYAYYSKDGSVSYSTNSLLPDYMWYCFKKAFSEAGMSVNEFDEAPSLYLMLNGMNDKELRFDINLYKGDDLAYAREVIVAMPFAHTGETDPSVLERSAYGLMDAAVAAILNDKAFKAALVQPPAGNIAAPVKKIEGTLVGIVKAVDAASSEVIVSSGKIAYMVNIGDTVYTVTEGGRINMEVSFPMQTIAKCRIKDRKNIAKIKSGDMVYK